MVLVSALLIYRIGQTFQDRLSFLQAYTVAAYGFSPLLLFHFLDASADMHPLVPWLLGIGLAVWILYQGIPRVMQPDPTHAFGVYLSGRDRGHTYFRSRAARHGHVFARLHGPPKLLVVAQNH